MQIKRGILGLLTSLILGASPVMADTKPAPPVKLAQSGAWTLYKGTYFFVVEEGFIGVEPSCWIETGNDAVKLQFAMFAAEISPDGTEFDGVVYLQAMAEAWKFRKHVANLNVGDESFNLQIGGTFYDNNFLMANMGGHGQSPAEFAAAAEIWSGTITLSDERNRKIGSFPAKGFGKLYPKLLKCGGS